MESDAPWLWSSDATACCSRVLAGEGPGGDGDRDAQGGGGGVRGPAGRQDPASPARGCIDARRRAPQLRIEAERPGYGAADGESSCSVPSSATSARTKPPSGSKPTRDCKVEILGREAEETFDRGPPYALVCGVDGLEPGQFTRLRGAARRRMVLAACRIPLSDERDPDLRSRGARQQDRLRILPGWLLPHRAALHAVQGRRRPRASEWDAPYALGAADAGRGPHGNRADDLLLMLGDQVYVDEGSPEGRGVHGGAATARLRAPPSRSRISRSTPASTASPGGTR